LSQNGGRFRLYNEGLSNGAALWNLSIGGGDKTTQMTLMQRLIDCLEE